MEKKQKTALLCRKSGRFLWWLGKSNEFKSSGCMMSSFRVKRSFLNSVTNLGGNIDFSQNFITFQVSPSVQSLDPNRIQSTLFGPEPKVVHPIVWYIRAGNIKQCIARSIPGLCAIWPHHCYS